MRIATLACLVVLAGCGRSQDQTASAQGCLRQAAHPVTWSDSDAPDTVEARAEGPTCRQAIVTLSIRNSAGDPLWSFSSPYHIMKAGEGPLLDDFAPVSAAEMDEFLANWSTLTAMDANELPEWREGEAELRGETFSYHTNLSQEAYSKLRESELGLVCYAGGSESSACLAVDPLSGAPVLMVTYGP